jgi:hypothetical protein
VFTPATDSDSSDSSSEFISESDES